MWVLDVYQCFVYFHEVETTFRFKGIYYRKLYLFLHLMIEQSSFPVSAQCVLNTFSVLVSRITQLSSRR